MTDLFDNPAQTGGADNEVPRDKWGRPLIVPPGGGKRVAYTRVTRFVGAPEDTYKLSRWMQRNVAFGMSRREDLMLAAASLSLSDKKKLDEIVDRANEAANSKGGATKGTALHTFTEQHDRGEDLGFVPSPYDRDLEAYKYVTAGLKYAAIEQFRVCDTYRIAGTADRLVDFGDRYVIADIKTGSIDFGAGKIAAQLASYANGIPYDPKTQARYEDSKPVDRTTGLVIHLPVGTGTCHLYWLDIAEGWKTVDLCDRIWKWRKAKTEWLTPVNPGELEVSTRPKPVRDSGVYAGVSMRAVTDPGELADATQRITDRPDVDSLVAQALSFDDLGALRQWYQRLDFRGHATPEVLAACQTRASQLA